jgi:hypothetical protein
MWKYMIAGLDSYPEYKNLDSQYQSCTKFIGNDTINREYLAYRELQATDEYLLD